MKTYRVNLTYTTPKKKRRGATLIVMASTTSGALRHGQRWIEERTSSPILSMMVTPIASAEAPVFVLVEEAL